MGRLVVNPGSRVAWEIVLKLGANSIGRGADNDFQVGDPSVSTHHCQITVTAQGVVLKDLGSTNGTFVNRAPVREAALQPGQSVCLGSVEMLFQEEAPAPAGTAAIHPVVVVPEPPEPALAASPASAIRLSVSKPAPVAVSAAPPPVLAETEPVADEGPHSCRFHPKSAARYRCTQCGLHFCELCVTSRDAAGSHQKFCRHCGVPCVPVRVQLARSVAPERGFFARLPGAFIYPFRGSGSLILIAATILFACLNWLVGDMRYGIIPRTMGFGLMAQVFALGYTFTYMQSLIHAAAIGDDHMPPLPSASNAWSDILLPSMQLIGLALFCFAPVILAGWWANNSEEPSWLALVGALILSCIYFPMAFLSVALLDSVMAANPLQVIPSILKVPLQYLVAVALLAVVLGMRPVGSVALHVAFPKGIMTHSVAQLLAFMGLTAFWNFCSIYLLTVAMRILGLLYYTNREKLAWLSN